MEIMQSNFLQYHCGGKRHSTLNTVKVSPVPYIAQLVAKPGNGGFIPHTNDPVTEKPQIDPREPRPNDDIIPLVQ